MRPNVLMIVLDAARRDALEPYGAPPGTTPAIAQLADRGAALRDVYATSCWTVPSHASIFTGLLPRAAGLARVGEPGVAKPVLERHRSRVLPEVMRRAGYATAAASANLWVSPTTGFDTGFDRFVTSDTGRNAQIHLTAPRERLRWIAEGAMGRVDDGAARLETTLDRWLAASPARPFFWFVNVLECHSPYLPPRPYGDVSLIDRLRAAQDARRYYTLMGIWRVCAGATRVPQATLERMRRLYRGSISYMDAWLGRILQRLQDHGILEDTLVVVTSDHGENLGEGGLIAHALSLDNRLIHVPFIVAGPGADTTPIHSLADLPRFLAEAVGLEDHPWHDGPPAGLGIAQLDPPLAGEEEARAVERLASVGLADAFDSFTAPLTCAVSGDLKLLRRGDREEVFDLAADPNETSPLEPDRTTVAEDSLRHLRAALDHPSVSSKVAGEDAVPRGTASDEEVRVLEDRMRLLGYM